MVTMASSKVLDLRTAGGIYGKGCIVTTAGAATVPAGAECNIFLDEKNTNTTSNLANGANDADGNFWSGRCPNGEIITLFGIQLAIYEVDANDVPQAGSAPITQMAVNFCSVKLQLKGQQYVLGHSGLYPSGLGSNGLNLNGGRAVAPFRFPRAAPIQLVSNDQFYLTIRAELAGITLAANDNKLMFSAYCPASRGVSLANLSGA